MTDKLELELVDSPKLSGGVIDNITSFAASIGLESPNECNIELGDDGSFAEIEQAVGPGARYSVRLNGRKIVSGRVEANDQPLDAQAGAVVRFTVRSWLADAWMTSADPTLTFKGNLAEWLYALYARIGVGPDQFVFNSAASRQLRTGVRTGGSQALKLTKLKVEEARVQPGETIYAAADRLLRRSGLMHWDGHDDTIVVGFPDNDQDPLYFLQAKRGAAGAGNNLLGLTRTRDYSSVPSYVAVHGIAPGPPRTRIARAAVDQDAVDAGFMRPVHIVAEGIRNAAAAQNAAERELSARIKDKDILQTEYPGLSYLDPRSGQQIAFAPDTMASFESDTAGSGLYYVRAIELSRDAHAGDTARITGMRKGLWRLFPEAFEGALRA